MIDDATAQAVLQDLAAGRALTAIARERGFSRQSFYAWRDKVPNRADIVARAREDGAEALLEETVDISDSEPDPHRARVRIEARREFVKMILPGKYGPKLDLNVNQRIDIGTLHAAALARLRSGRDQAQTLIAQTIDGEQVLVPHPTDCGSVASPAPAEFVPTCIDDLG